MKEDQAESRGGVLMSQPLPMETIGAKQLRFGPVIIICDPALPAPTLINTPPLSSPSSMFRN